MRGAACAPVCVALLSWACQADPDSETNWQVVPNDGLMPGAGGSGGHPVPRGEGGGWFFSDPPDAGDWGPACEGRVLPAAPLVGEVQREVSYEVPQLVPYEVVVDVEVELEEPARTVLYIMLDRSTSMGESEECASDAPVGCVSNGEPTKWELAVEGVRRFVAEPGEADLDVALGYFPSVQFGGASCDGTGYDEPTVPRAPLPANQDRILTSLGATSQFGWTPTAGALRGLVSYCEQHRSAHPDERCVGVLVTDGAPSQCDPQDAFGLAVLAGEGITQGIQVFAAGMPGADFSVLDAVARAGHGDCTPTDDKHFACDLTGDPEALAAALRRIASEPMIQVRRETVTQQRMEIRTETRTETRIGALPCEWGLPALPSEMEFDPELVNVRVGVAGHWQALGRVESAVACPEFEAGWYFHQADQRWTVRACEDTCDVLKKFGDIPAEIQLGCRSVPARLR